MSDTPRPDRTEPPGPSEPHMPEEFGEQIEGHVRRTRLAGLFLQSPSFMAVTRGPEHVFVNANPTYRELVGERDLIGRAAEEAFSDVAGPGFLELLNQVYETGEPYVGSEEPVRLRRGEQGELETVFVSYSYHPLRDGEGNVSGILHHGIDVTERVELRRHLRRRARQQRAVGELGRSALKARSLSAVLREVVETAREALDGDAAVLYRPAEEGLLARAETTGAEPDAFADRALALDGSHLVARVYRRQGSALVRPAAGGGAGGEDAPLRVAVPVPGGDGRPLGILAVEARDEEAFDEEDVPILQAVAQTAGAAMMRHEQQRFRETVARNLPGLLYRCRNDRDWTMEFLSEGTEELTGYAPEELEGEDGPAYADLIHPEDRGRVWERVQSAVRADRSFHLQYRIETKEGEQRWVWEQGRGVQPTTGESSLLEGYVFDVTEWREAEREAGRLDSVLQAAFRITREALFVVQLPERTIVECNPGAEELFGYGREELLGQSTEILHVDSEHQEEFGRRSEEVLRRDGFYRGEFEMRRKDGTVFPTDHSVTYVEGAADPPGYAVSIIRDIGERKERKARLERSRRLLEKHAAHVTEARERERAEIAREVHDELGQTLTGLKFQLETLSDHAEGDPDAEVAARKSLELLGSVLDRVRELSESLRPAHLDSVGLRRSLAQLVERWEETTGLEAEYRYRGPDEGLGEDRNIHVYRVLQEALTNVARHAEATRVLVEVRGGEERWSLRVRDDGVGFSDARPDGPRGHGILGMRERARLLGGEVRIRGERGEGTEVELVAPTEGTEGDE